MNNFIQGLQPLWPMLVGYRWRTVAILALMFVAGLTEFAGLYMLIPLLDIVIGGSSGNSGRLAYIIGWFGAADEVRMFSFAGLIMIAAMSVKNILSIMTARGRVKLSMDLRNQWAERIFDSALRSPLATLSRNRTGELVEAISSETQKAGNAVSSLLEAAHRLILSLVLLGGVLVTAPLLTLAVSLAIAVCLFVLHLLGIFRSIEEGRRMLNYTREIANVSAETMAHVRQIKLLDAYAERSAILRRALDSFAKVRVRFETASQIPAAAIEMMVVIPAVAALIITQRWYPETLRVAVPTLALFVVVANRLVATLGSLSVMTMKLNVGLANVGYVAQRLDEESRAENLDVGEEFQGGCSVIRLDRVVFAWPGGAKVLDQASMEFQRGQVTAIIGASGRGKSTVAAILCGLLLPDAGALFIDAQPLTRYSLRSLRRRIGYVTQEVELFHGTIADNVRMGCPDATDAEVIAACRAARADAFISAMPHGYATLVGERGATLSGGQRQRIAIARALLGRRSIYIFDEATSALDEETQALVQQTVNEIRKSAVVIVIAHRPSAIRGADRVYRLEPDGSACLVPSHETFAEGEPLDT